MIFYIKSILKKIILTGVTHNAQQPITRINNFEKKLNLTWYFSLEIKTAKLKKISVDIKLEHTKFKL